MSQKTLVPGHRAAVSQRAGRRIEDCLLGGTIAFWALVALFEGQALRSPVRLGAAALGLSVGVLIILRSAPHRRGSWRTAAAALPSLAMGWVATRWAPPPEEWSLAAQGLFLTGCAIAVASFFTLGRSFSVLPAVRTIITAGPYRIVRHPAYVGELLLAFACLASVPSLPGVLLVVLASALTMVRIHVEERLLHSDPDYARYVARVPYRLLPGVW